MPISPERKSALLNGNFGTKELTKSELLLIYKAWQDEELDSIIVLEALGKYLGIE